MDLLVWGARADFVGVFDDLLGLRQERPARSGLPLSLSLLRLRKKSQPVLLMVPWWQPAGPGYFQFQVWSQPPSSAFPQSTPYPPLWTVKLTKESLRLSLRPLTRLREPPRILVTSKLIIRPSWRRNRTLAQDMSMLQGLHLEHCLSTF